MNLYELTEDYQVLQEYIEKGQDLDALLSEVDAEIDQKAESYGKVIRNMEADIESIKREKKRLTDNQGVLENAVKRLKENLQASMIATGKRKIKTDLFTFSIQKNGGSLPVILDVDVSELPDEFVIVSEKPDLKAIAKYIEETGDVTQFHFGERGESLQIR